MMASEDFASYNMRQRFYEELAKNHTMEDKKYSSSLNEQGYESLINEILNIKNAGRKNPRHYKLKKKFEVIVENGKSKLICNRSEVDNKIIYYVTENEKFDLIQSTHNYLGHARRDQMHKELKKKYKNITRQDVITFLELCEPCKNKCGRFKGGYNTRRKIVSDVCDSPCQSDTPVEKNDAPASSNFGKHTKINSSIPSSTRNEAASQLRNYRCEDKSSPTRFTIKSKNNISDDDCLNNQDNRKNPAKRKCSTENGLNSSNVNAADKAKSSEAVSSTVIKYILEKIDQKQTPVQVHPVDAFLAGIAASLKTFTPYNLSLAKARIFSAVHELEMAQTVEQQGHYNNGTSFLNCQ